jgi:hypothetical protein
MSGRHSQAQTPQRILCCRQRSAGCDGASPTRFGLGPFSDDTGRQGVLSTRRARVKVLDPLTSIGPSMEAELVSFSASDYQLRVPRWIVPGSTVQVLTAAKVEFGSRTTLNQTNIGLTSSSMTGVIMLCASFMSVTAAPIAMKIEPNIKTASDRKAIKPTA